MSGPERNRDRRRTRREAATRAASDNYELGAQLTYQAIMLWTHAEGPPVFRFPPKNVALLADLRDCGEKLAVNQSARDLVAKLVTEVVAATGQAPTAMMLRVILEELAISIHWVEIAELGLNLRSPGVGS